MKRYIKQLTYAKLQCERRLRLLGVQTNDVSRTSSSSMGHGIDDMAPPFKTVMRNPQLRQQLESYLEQQGESQVIIDNKSFEKLSVGDHYAIKRCPVVRLAEILDGHPGIEASRSQVCFVFSCSTLLHVLPRQQSAHQNRQSEQVEIN